MRREAPTPPSCIGWRFFQRCAAWRQVDDHRAEHFEPLASFPSTPCLLPSTPCLPSTPLASALPSPCHPPTLFHSASSKRERAPERERKRERRDEREIARDTTRGRERERERERGRQQASMAREQRACVSASACTAWQHAFPMFVSTAWLLEPGPWRRKPMLEPYCAGYVVAVRGLPPQRPFRIAGRPEASLCRCPGPWHVRGWSRCGGSA